MNRTLAPGTRNRQDRRSFPRPDPRVPNPDDRRDLESYRPHQRQRIAVGDRTRLHQVVEPHFGAVEPVLEVHVRGARRQRLGHGGHGEIVRRDQADSATIEQAPQHTFGACQAIVRVGAMEELVEQEEQRNGSGRDVRQLTDPGDLGVEARPPLEKRILNAQRRPPGATTGATPHAPAPPRVPGLR
jgi:hypothetical protein